MTRHVADELKKDDWNTLVLHYLGLDHIGHKGGPRRYVPCASCEENVSSPDEVILVPI